MQEPWIVVRVLVGVLQDVVVDGQKNSRRELSIQGSRYIERGEVVKTDLKEASINMD